MLDISTQNPRSLTAPGIESSFPDVIDVLRRKWIWFLLGVGLALGAGGLYLFIAKPSYSATAQLLIDTKRSDSPGAQFSIVDTAVVESQIETLKTDKIAVAVIKKLALDQDPEFIVPGRLTRLLATTGLVQLEHPSTEQGRLRASMEKFKRALNVARIGPSYLANITFASVDADKAARIANEIADAYVEDQLSARALSAERANSWMQKRIAELRQQADGASQAVDNIPADQPEQKQRLEAAAQAAKRAYDTFQSLTRYTQNTAERAFPVTEARLMSPALPPLTRTSPNVPIVAGVSLLAGCFLGLALALVRERFDHAIQTRKQLEKDAGLQILGFLPIFESWRSRATLRFDLRQFSLSRTRKERLAHIFDKRRGGAADMLVGLKLFIDDNVESQTGKVIGITSPRAGEGKTTLAFNLASSIAQSCSRVILIDANLRNPSVTRVLAPWSKPGILALGSEQEEGGRSVVTLVPYDFDVLESQQGPTAKHPAFTLGSRAMKELLEELRQDYDYVIVDLPQALDYVDVKVCANHLDGVIMLVRFGQTRMDDLLLALDEMALVRDRLLGAVVNSRRMPGGRRR
jgi:Mrp family chromosome partitioning ATPase/capsular polysaccharide biosynthesis protein